MFSADLNLLTALDVLLAEGSVAKAAKRLQLSPSAMSRTLARLREATGDALLVRAGRGLVPTPRALALGETVGVLVREAEAMLRPVEGLDLSRLERTFTMRAREGFVENFGAELVSRVMAVAPKVRLRFVAKADKDSGPLRYGSVDLETGVVESVIGPEIRTQRLFDDRYVGVVRAGHPLAGAPVSMAAYAASTHVRVLLQGSEQAPIDDWFAPAGIRRNIVSDVSGFAAALALARGSDLVATVPERHTRVLRAGMASFRLPVPLPEFTVSLLWHPRSDGDPAHRWLRGCVREVCASAL
ncbi:LysR family transcriptional regulator [Phenylobacterium sp. LH3H17]|uniref:LysR family transcriptional regulator n=1 Tax=Phenylobacterium sp. LH3H17 TaxID=2903901 RepID=UPI0020CA0721|nr:LysR family transcriptional regulator [Phenylobacterium sp. LH3H17]UTP40942.1 LysR family transcriptional regulator [Phenylobacterium sp. LH3H17]